MSANFDVNRSMEHKKTGVFSKVVIAIALLVVSSIFLYLILNGKHNKLPVGIETNIPLETPDTVKRDTISINSQTNEINIEENKGDIIVNQVKK